jgi:asparagine synthase (glutamine-hydrolysing)
MCGFLVSAAEGDNRHIRRRGPDATHSLRAGGLTFVHNLLSTTGICLPQPFVEDDIVCVYNGQIYNQPFTRSDGEVLIPLYKEHGVTFARHLDGEFAIALYDFRNRVAVFATDPFKSKPLFINGIECASYRSGVGGEKASPNTILVKTFAGDVVERMTVRDWDLCQWKTTYDDWIVAFEQAVAKRARNGCFLGLSSGYDSGGIACALLTQGIDFKAFIFEGEENRQILADRSALLAHEYFSPDRALRDWLRNEIDDEPYTIVCDGQAVSMTVLEDGATVGLATFARLASQQGRRIALSGQGADEIMSDYSPWPAQSELKGTFPDPLALWQNFNYSCQESYLIKEEYAGGAFGIESRYPYLDGAVVQEFLWLSTEAKNRHYKAPLREYLIRHDFPFEENAKRGFTVDLSQ